MLFDVLAETSDGVAATAGRNDKVAMLASVLRQLAPDEIGPAVLYLTGTTPHGRIGVGWAALADAQVAPANNASLTISEVDSAVGLLALIEGAGVRSERRRLLRDLLSMATDREQRFLTSVLGGELRQGALEGVMVSAVAKAAGVPVGKVRRAAMMSGDLAVSANAALTGGVDELDAVTMTPLRPVLPMLASPAGDVGEALAATGPAAVEWKLDGARVQAHRRDGEVRLFTRKLHEVTDRLPLVVRTVEAIPGGDVVLDGEVMGLGPDGSPGRFQDTMGDFGAAGSAGRGGELRPFFFDVIHLDGSPLHDEPLSVRRGVLASVVPEYARLPSIVTADESEASEFMAAALRAGHEGVMVKGLDRPYEAGRRGGAWRKVKPVHTFDLVVLAVEWGHGRRRGLLSNIHLGALADEPGGGFVMVGKTFKGLTDEMLRWQTARFSALEIGREGHVVHVEPVQVVEIAIDGVQVSNKYPGGIALRFARVRHYRADKSAGEADAIADLRALL